MLNEKITRSQAMRDHAHGSFGPKRGQKKVKGKKKNPIYPKDKKATEGPQGKLPDHTVYQDMGYLMAESLGLVSETTRKDTYGGTGPDRMSKTPFKRKESTDKYDSNEALKTDLATRKSSGKGFIGKGDTADNTIAVDRLSPEEVKRYNTGKLRRKARETGKPQIVIRRKKR